MASRQGMIRTTIALGIALTLGVPLTAGLNVTVSSSPALIRFGPVADTPALTRTLAEPVVSDHTLASPCAFLMEITSAPCGFTKANF